MRELFSLVDDVLAIFSLVLIKNHHKSILGLRDSEVARTGLGQSSDAYALNKGSVDPGKSL